MKVAMPLTTQSAQTLSLVCLTIVFLQTVLIKRRKRTSEIRMVDMSDLLKTTATSPSCDVPDDGRGLRVGPSELHGNGVFATRLYTQNEIIEVCPLIRVPNNAQVALSWYFFRDPQHPDGGTIALGYGSMYNHSSAFNAMAVFPENGTMTVHATKIIENGEEVVINYGPKYWRLMSEINEMLRRLPASFSGKSIGQGENEHCTNDPHDQDTPHS